MTQTRLFTWIALATLCVATAAIYVPGLSGPFLFDDNIHIAQNRWVKIEALDWHSLAQAWNSSFTQFPSNRPLSQLSFGITHALAGDDPWAFKAGNVAIHLLSGLFVYIFGQIAYRALSGGRADPKKQRLLAVGLTALWLLHPLHVSTVLYAVQRMALISTLGLLAAMCVYLWGRLRIAEGKPGLVWMLAAVPIAAIAFLGKENAVLLPLLLLACEVALLRGVSTGDSPWRIRAVWLILIGLPLVVAVVYLLTHPGLLNYASRPFTFEERVLTQPRVLWLYLRWLFVPDVAQLGLFHDDIPLSKGMLNPPTTLFAILGLLALFVASLSLRNKAASFSFAVLFFLAAHALESSIFPLEMVFEHRNYLASLGPLFLVSYLLTIQVQKSRLKTAAMYFLFALVITYGAATFLRAQNWSSYESFVLTSAENHPRSARAQFMAGQLAISMLTTTEGDKAVIAEAADDFLRQGLTVNERCLNCLFGLLVLDLHLDREPERDTLDRLKATLREGPVDASRVSVSQFTYLVEWMKSGASTLGNHDIESLFNAALQNPRWSNTGRASIEAAYRKYFEFVAEDLEAALVHARAAIRAWPTQWSYHIQLVEVLRKLGRIEEAQAALQKAGTLSKNAKQRAEVERLTSKLAQSVAQ